jgi:hypothetical protein
MADQKRYFSGADAEFIKDEGKPYHKKPSTVYLFQVTGNPDDHFVIETREGQLTSPCGSYVAYDPKSGDVWPIAADYVAMHYAEGELSSTGSSTTDVPPGHAFHVVTDAGHRFQWKEWVDEDDQDHLVVHEQEKTTRS